MEPAATRQEYLDRVRAVNDALCGDYPAETRDGSPDAHLWPATTGALAQDMDDLIGPPPADMELVGDDDDEDEAA